MRGGEQLMTDKKELKTPTQEQAEKAQKELDEVKKAEVKKMGEEMLKAATSKMFVRTRYVYEVMDQSTLRSMFEISFFESNPDNVLAKANRILANNSANPAALSLKLKYLEVLD